MDAAAALTPVRLELAALIGASTNPAEAQTRIAEWAHQHQDTPGVSMAVYRAAALADFAGQMFVRLIEVPASAKFDAYAPPAFLRMPFAEAVQFFLDRFGNDEQAYALLDGYRARADEATRRLIDRVAERARDYLQETLEQGGTLDGFAASVRDASAGLGIEAPSPTTLERLYRTVVQTSYGAGRVRQMEEPAVIAARPGVEYRTVGDNRVCDICSPLDGKQWRITDLSWKNVAPPNHPQDRCSVVTLDEDEIDPAALRRKVTTSPLPGFEGPPTEHVARPM